MDTRSTGQAMSPPTSVKTDGQQTHAASSERDVRYCRFGSELLLSVEMVRGLYVPVALIGSRALKHLIGAS